MSIDVNGPECDERVEDKVQGEADGESATANDSREAPILPSPLDKRKIFNLTSVSPFVRIAKQSEEKGLLRKQRQEDPVPETPVIDVMTGAKKMVEPKPYILPKGIPELPKDNLKEWFTMLEQAKRERKDALEILETMKEALAEAKRGRDEANAQLETSTATNSELLVHIQRLEGQLKENKESYEKQLDELRVQLENNKFHSDNAIEKWKKKYKDGHNAWTDKFELLKQRLEEQKKKTSNAIQMVKDTKESTASLQAQLKTDLEIVANKKCLKYEEENQNLLKDISVLRSRLKHFTTQGVGRQQKVTDASAVKAAYETVKRLKLEIETQKTKIVNLNETNEELRSKNEEMSSTLTSTTKEVETLKSFMRKRVGEANKAKEVVSDLLRNARYERARIEKENEALTAKMKIAHEEMVGYRKEINEKTRTIKRYDQSTNTLRREKDELKKQISLLKEDNVKLQGEKDKIIQENFEKTSSVQQLDTLKKHLQDDVVKIQKELKDALKALKHAKSRIKQVESELRHEKANFKEQNENFRDASRQAKAMQRKLQEERQERREEVAALVAKAEVATSRLTEALNAKHKTVMRLSQANQKIQHLKDELSRSETALHSAEGAAKEARQWGERALAQAKKSFSRKLIEEMSVLRSGHEQANKEVDTKNNEIMKLQNEIKTLMQEKEKSREDLMKFQQQHFYGEQSQYGEIPSHHHKRGHHNDEKYRHEQGHRNESSFYGHSDRGDYKTREEMELDADIDEVDRMMEKERIMVERVVNNADRPPKARRDNGDRHQGNKKRRSQRPPTDDGARDSSKPQRQHKRPPLLPQNTNTMNRKSTHSGPPKKQASVEKSHRDHLVDDEGRTPPSSGAQDVILEATKFIRRRQQARRRARNE